MSKLLIVLCSIMVLIKNTNNIKQGVGAGEMAHPESACCLSARTGVQILNPSTHSHKSQNKVRENNKLECKQIDRNVWQTCFSQFISFLPGNKELMELGEDYAKRGSIHL